MSSKALKEIIAGLKDGRDIAPLKKAVAKKYGLSRIPTNPQILAAARAKDRIFLEPLLRKKPVRTISGIAVIAVMARPYECPGRCIYCPTGKDSPKSYTGKEPATMRAKRAGYDPYLQVRDRINQLRQIGHITDKAELIVMGGTFTSQPLDYQEWFVKRCIEAMNSFSGKIEWNTLEDAQEVNEKAEVRNVGITFETRPDYAKEKEADRMLRLGVTRVELGVQTTCDSIYKKVRRGHSVKDVIEATKILKDSGLKAGYHMMPGLFSDVEQDMRMFREVFENEEFKPDFVKIYPTLVIRGTELYEHWKRGEFTPYSDEEAIELITRVKEIMPKWTRTMRIQRDIPSYLIEAGVKRGDLGDIVYQRVKGKCKCIRCREVGHLAYKDEVEIKEIEILDEEYKASGGIEHFISLEDLRSDAIVAYLRLRFPSANAHRSEVDGHTSLVRELRVLGPVVPIGRRLKNAKQHRGFGKKLLKKAEEISAENGREHILINSAIGTRNYYRKFGYKRVGPYMGKSLT